MVVATATATSDQDCRMVMGRDSTTPKPMNRRKVQPGHGLNS